MQNGVYFNLIVESLINCGALAVFQFLISTTTNHEFDCCSCVGRDFGCVFYVSHVVRAKLTRPNLSVSENKVISAAHYYLIINNKPGLYSTGVLKEIPLKICLTNIVVMM